MSFRRAVDRHRVANDDSKWDTLVPCFFSSSFVFSLSFAFLPFVSIAMALGWEYYTYIFITGGRLPHMAERCSRAQ